ncbi:MAG TPA: hypothetical protein VFW87_18380, partial [Pirellulales bacterium]|nr:hypothetical protein [Pirellulales bacterium]
MNHLSLAPDRTSRAWYSDSIAEFIDSAPDRILGRLAANSDFAVLPEQRDAWLIQIRLLQAHLPGLSGWLFMEFNIPRMGRRIDTVLLIGPAVFVVEFKVGDAEFKRAAVDQVWDYALDLKNFHSASHAAPIAPILIATCAEASPPVSPHIDQDQVFRPISICPSDIRGTFNVVLQSLSGTWLDEHWGAAPYRPTPTIIEAARALYAQHSVEAIARYDAGA